MVRAPKYAAVIVDDGDNLTITQYANATQAKIDYREALAEGYTAYFYARPMKRKTTLDDPAPIEIIE